MEGRLVFNCSIFLNLHTSQAHDRMKKKGITLYTEDNVKVSYFKKVQILAITLYLCKLISQKNKCVGK